jgi:hypothetical protein
MLKIVKSAPTSERQEVINWLVDNNYPTLPVAPAQPAEKYFKCDKKTREAERDKEGNLIPLFTGKNPSYLDQNGIPHLVNHRRYQSQLPSDRELKNWFANPLNGVGTLGGWNNTIWLDLDLKQFASKEECASAFRGILEAHPELAETFLEESHSGGWRIGVRLKQKPNFTNFTLTPGGAHVGEALGVGRFTVLAPTIGPSGNSYKSINRVLPVEVETLESIGVYPVSSKAPSQALVTPQPTVSYIPGSIPLEQLGNDTSREILQGKCPTGDRSEALTTALNEWYGWQNWTRENGIAVTGTPEDLAHYAGGQLEIDSDRVERILKTIDINACNPAALHKGGEESCWKKIRRLDKASFEAKCPLRLKNAIEVELKPANSNVTGDTSLSGDSQNTDILSIAATVTTVTGILKSGFPDWMELNKLEAVRVKSELSHKPAFNALVNRIKNQFDEVQPEDEVRLQSLINWHNTELDFRRALPSMAEDILHDASILNVDPIGIWQYLFTTVLSLTGKRVNLVLDSHEIPAIAWTGILGESGAGKTRVEKLVTSPLKQLQKLARERFTAEMAEWEETVANWKEGDGRKPPKPVERKYLFDVATIQAVMRRQSEQGMNGSLWVRDELIGIFQSFGQFNKGENEALSCLLAAWDGGSTQVDRVNQEDSYIIDSSRLSITGGIQPGVFKKIFKDSNDSQGLQARFLFAAMKPRKPKRVKGFCCLSEKLPPMYQWLDNLPEGKVKLSTAADQYYDKLYEQIGEQAMNTAMPAIRAWMFKLPAQLLRIALALHLIECYHDPNRPIWTLQKDTLERAVLFAQYYRSTFHIIQTTAVETDDISAILLQIWDKALTRHPEGISTRDAYREIKAIQHRAKDAGRPVAAYTADLFGKLQQMGKGSVVKNGRLIKFVANLTPPPISPDDIDGVKPESRPPGDRVTVAETIDISRSELSPDSELSPVTLPQNVVADAQQNEVSEEVEEATPLEQMDATSADESEEAIAPQPEQLEQEDEGFSEYCNCKRPYPVEENSLARALNIRAVFLTAEIKHELMALKKIYSADELKWVQAWLKKLQPRVYEQYQGTLKRVS